MPKSNNAFFHSCSYSRIPAYILKIGMLLITLYTSIIYILAETYIVHDPIGTIYQYLPAVEFITISLLWLIGGSILLDRLFRRL